MRVQPCKQFVANGIRHPLRTQLGFVNIDAPFQRIVIIIIIKTRLIGEKPRKRIAKQLLVPRVMWLIHDVDKQLHGSRIDKIHPIVPSAVPRFPYRHDAVRFFRQIKIQKIIFKSGSQKNRRRIVDIIPFIRIRRRKQQSVFGKTSYTQPAAFAADNIGIARGDMPLRKLRVLRKFVVRKTGGIMFVV